MKQLPNSDVCWHWQLNCFLICSSKAKKKTYCLFPKFLANENLQKVLHKPSAGGLNCIIILMKTQGLLSQNNVSLCWFMGNDTNTSETEVTFISAN